MRVLWKVQMFLFLLVYVQEGGHGQQNDTNSTDVTSEPGRAMNDTSTATPPISTQSLIQSTTALEDNNLTIELVPVTLHSGYVLLIINGEAGTICTDGFNDIDAFVICRMLGFSVGVASAFGPVEERVWLSELACWGNETSILDCRARWNPQSCWSDQVATVSCTRTMPPADEIVVELVGGDDKSGRVELIMYGERGTVCDDRWDSNDAKVICRMLGFAGGRAYGNAHHGEGVNKTWLDEVGCVGNETSISECRLDIDKEDCTHSEDASVLCHSNSSTVELVGAVFPRMGRLEIVIDDVRGTVCDIAFSQWDANVVCRELGYKTAKRTNLGTFGGGDENFWFNTVDCDGDELSILDCKAAFFKSLTCSLDVGVICSDTPDLAVSLLGAKKDEGQAVAKFQWVDWDLCPDWWDDGDASVLCKSLGYTDGKAYQGEQVKLNGRWLADLGCSGNETHVTQCDQSGWIANCSQNTPSFAVCTYDKHVENVRLGLNIVFLLPNSMGISPDAKTLQQYIMNEIIDGIDALLDGYTENPYSTGLITYSSSSNTELFLGLCLNTSCSSEDLNNIMTFSNEIGNAVEDSLDLAMAHFSDHAGHRILAPNFCILFVTSPLENVSQAMDAAQRLKDMGVILMVVSVGNRVTSDQLEGLASNDKVLFSAEVGENPSMEGLKHVANETAESVLKVQKFAQILPRYSKCFHGYIDFAIIIDLQENKEDVVDQLITFVKNFKNAPEVVINIWIKDDPTSQHLLPLQELVYSNRKFSLSISNSFTEMMEMARLYYVEEHQDRKLAENIVIIVTDELFTEDIEAVEKEACMCQQAKIHVMALGVGNKIASEQLSSIVTDARGFAFVHSAKHLQKGLDGLVKKLCPAVCDVGWVYYEGGCYRAEITRSSWLDAQKHCSSMDASLISITTPEIELWLHSTFLQGNPEIKYALIGLRKQEVDGAPLSYGYRWENGKPHQYSRCCLKEEDGDCVFVSAETTMWNSMACEQELLSSFYEVLLVCEKQAANNTISKVADVAPLYEENTCTLSSSSDILDASGNQCRSVLDVFQSRKFVNYTFTCINKELISSHLLCDGLRHCTDGSDEVNCSSTCGTDQFPCDNGRCVSLTYMCDFINDCGDNSDEAKCVYATCEASEFQCDSGQCIASTLVCDLYNDCFDRTDERDCEGKCRQFQCKDGPCIPMNWLRDGITDCDENEEDTDISKDILTYTGQYSQLSRLYLNISKHVDLSCTMIIDQFGKPFTMDNCNEPVICPIGFYRCPASYCIPIDRICDGVMDCTDGEDEADCGDYLCPGYFRCPGLSYCIHPALVCDGEVNCPGGKDEVLCDFTCPSYCSCNNGNVVCNDIGSVDVDDLDPRTRSLDISDSSILNAPFDKFEFLVRAKARNVGLTGVAIISNNFNLREVDLSRNNISHILRRSFVNLRELKSLDLSFNSFEAIDATSYIGLDLLEILILKSNSITKIGIKSFAFLANLRVLDVSDNFIQEIQDDAFYGLVHLWSLSMHNNKITKFERGIYKGVDNILRIKTDVFALCCPTVRPKSVINCVSPESSISSCDDLLGNDILRLCIWVLCIASLFGNIMSTVMRICLERASMKNGFGVFVTNLGISDFLMGAYLMIIAIADNYFRGRYVWNDTSWRESIYCKLAGFLSTLSSEASTLFICLITLDRFLVIWFPFKNVRFRLRSGIVASVIAWIIAAVIAYLPLSPWFMHWDFYGKNGACLALPFSTERSPGWLYSTIIFTGLNFGSFMFIAIGQYLIYRAIKQDAMVASSVGRKRELAVARGLLLIVGSDFLCWFPVGVMSLIALSGTEIGGEVYAFTAVFVLPINSALNPFLYTIPALLKKRKMAKKRSAKSLYSTNNNPSTTVMTTVLNDHIALEEALEQVNGSLKAQILEEIIKRLSTLSEPIESETPSKPSEVDEREPLPLYVKYKWLSKQKHDSEQSSEAITKT